VAPTNIQVIDGKKVIVISSGGTQTNVPLSSLTRAQAISLSQGQSITLKVNINVQVPFNTVAPGAIIQRSPEAVALAGNLVASEVSVLLSTLLKDSSYKFVDEKPNK
jgi:hypothetical protein